MAHLPKGEVTHLRPDPGQPVLLDRVDVHGHIPEYGRDIQGKYARRYEHQYDPETVAIREREIWQTPERRAAVNAIIDIINGERRQYGIPESPLTAKQVHFYWQTDFQRALEAAAAGRAAAPKAARAPENSSEQSSESLLGDYSQQRQLINVTLSEGETTAAERLGDLGTLVHEICHAISFQEVDVDKFGQLRGQRVGTHVTAPVRQADGSKMPTNLFTIINEVLTESEAQKLLADERIQNVAPYREDFQTMKRFLASHPDFDAETRRIGAENNFPLAPNGLGTDRFAYLSGRRSLDRLLELTAERAFHPQTGKHWYTKQDLYDLLHEAWLSGSYMKFARAINRAFGAGTFRQLALQTGDTNSFRDFVEGIGGSMTSDQEVEALLAEQMARAQEVGRS